MSIVSSAYGLQSVSCRDVVTKGWYTPTELAGGEPAEWRADRTYLVPSVTHH